MKPTDILSRVAAAAAAHAANTAGAEAALRMEMLHVALHAASMKGIDREHLIGLIHHQLTPDVSGQTDLDILSRLRSNKPTKGKRNGTRT